MTEPCAVCVRFTDKQQRNAFSIVKNCDNDWFTAGRGATEKPGPVGVPVMRFSIEVMIVRLTKINSTSIAFFAD